MFNKAQIMANAWGMARNMAARNYGSSPKQFISQGLRWAWGQAREAVRVAHAAAAHAASMAATSTATLQGRVVAYPDGHYNRIAARAAAHELRQRGA